MKMQRFFALAVLMVGIGGCATAREGIEQPPITLVVENNLIPANTLTIFADPQTTSRFSIGVAPSGTTSRFSITRSNSADFVFIGQTAAGEELRSDMITLGPGDAATWNLTANIVIPGDATSDQ